MKVNDFADVAKTNPIKPNFRKAKMKLSFYSTKYYENKPRLPAPPKQTQSNPISKGIPYCSASVPNFNAGSFPAGRCRHTQHKFERTVVLVNLDEDKVHSLRKFYWVAFLVLVSGPVNMLFTDELMVNPELVAVIRADPDLDVHIPFTFQPAGRIGEDVILLGTQVKMANIKEINPAAIC